MIAWIFPGQGSQTAGMGRALAAEVPEFAAARESLEAAIRLPLHLWFNEMPAAPLTKTEVTQPAISALSLCIGRVFVQSEATRPSVVAGHSVGHITALVAAGALDSVVALDLIKRRGALFADAECRVKGAMAVVSGLSFNAIESLLSNGNLDVWAVNENHPDQVAISGRADSMPEAMALLSNNGAICKRLNVSGAFHCPLLSEESLIFSDLIDRLPLRDPICPILSNETALALTTARDIRSDLHRHMLAPVRWRGIVEGIFEMGIHQAIEMGPGRTLKGLCLKTERRLFVQDTSTPKALRKALALTSPCDEEVGA